MCRRWDGNDWSAERPLQTSGGAKLAMGAQPALAAYYPPKGNELLYCMGPGKASGSIQWTCSEDGIVWQPLRNTSQGTADDSVGLAPFGGSLCAVYNRAAQQYWIAGKGQGSGLTWSDETLIGPKPDSPAATSLASLGSSLVSVYVDGGGTQNSLAYRVYDTGALKPKWSAQQQLGSGQRSAKNNAQALVKDRLVCVYADFTGQGGYWLSWTTYDGDGWSGGRPAVDKAGNKIVDTYRVAAVGYRDRLFCVYSPGTGGLGWSVMHVPTDSGGGAQWDQAYWDTSQTLTSDSNAYAPALAAYNGNVYCVYLMD
ncbi:hypothetical protein ACH4PU_34145 [Streptomyces sp. NPDC021100]|uniref:hypothetical protein n=1 Tax=Streptomyces sp. NPDC021100 TaxID=3365114 RepID=UPI0037904848